MFPNCHRCKEPLTRPSTEKEAPPAAAGAGELVIQSDRPVACPINHAAQLELGTRLLDEGIDPEDQRCSTCGAIYDGGQACAYCGDRDPLGGGDHAS